ncbi:four helix bundle protein [bacterium]|nr:four helix bundle protein [bacterium]
MIELAKKVPKNTITIPIIDQLIRAGTSVGANYMEANGASSKKDFKNKIHICKKESKETMHWLRMLAKAHNETKKECRKLWQEAKEYAKIFSSIIKTMRIKN